MKLIKPVFVTLEVFVITFARKFWWIFGTIFFVGMVGDGVDLVSRQQAHDFSRGLAAGLSNLETILQ